MKNFKIQTLITSASFLIFTISAVAITVLVNHNMKEAALVEAQRKAAIISDLSLSIHTYYSHQLKPVLFKDYEHKMNKDYFRPEWMSSTYAVREVMKYFTTIDKEHYYYKECAINARSPENEADEFERDYIKGLINQEVPEHLTLVREFNDELYFVSLKKGETMTEDCLRCHSDPAAAPTGLVSAYGNSRSFNRSENEIVSAISVRIPLHEAFEEANSFSFILSCIMIFILISSFLSLLYITNRLMFNPLKKFRQRSDQIAQNHSALRETIEAPMGKEFDELASSFNTMSATINDYLVNLEQKVDDRTKALQEYSNNLQNEIQERVKAEDKLKNLVKEKEVLIQEVHHRVKNNFTIISNLIDLKSEHADEKSKTIFSEIDNALRSMAKIHESFYLSKDITNINLGQYFDEIARDLIRSMNLSHRKITLTTDMDTVLVNLNQAITCGLLINEIITNSIKHAFPPQWNGEPKIYISLKESGQSIVMTIGDNGTGIPSDSEQGEKSGDSLGLSLIQMLPLQLDGSITIDTIEGTEHTITFPKTI